MHSPEPGIDSAMGVSDAEPSPSGGGPALLVHDSRVDARLKYVMSILIAFFVCIRNGFAFERSSAGFSGLFTGCNGYLYD